MSVEHKNPLKLLFANYLEKGYRVACIHLSKQPSIFVTLEDTYYSKFNYHESRLLFLDNGTVFPGHIERHLPKANLQRLLATKVEYHDDLFVSFQYYDKEAPMQRDKEFYYEHQCDLITINISMIVSIEWHRHWELNGHSIYDDKVLLFSLLK